MSRRVVVTVLLPEPDPEPTYPEYEELREEARRQDRGPIGGQNIARMEDVVQRRRNDWCSAVLGRPFRGLQHVPSMDGFMLILADERGLEPELPTRMIEARRAAETRRREQEARQKEKLQAELRRWALIAGPAPVEFAVRENTRHTGVGGSLRHVTAAVDLLSGRSRLHKGGMGLCETPERDNPLRLGNPLDDLPPNCRRCIEYAGKVRSLDAPAPPTRAEVATLRLIQSGAIFTMRRPGHEQPTIRDTSTRGRDTAWGHLGRTVDAAVKKAEAKGWAKADDASSRTLLGQLGNLWRLTEAGTAALEG